MRCVAICGNGARRIHGVTARQIPLTQIPQILLVIRLIEYEQDRSILY